jgi:hypothetical protein
MQGQVMWWRAAIVAIVTALVAGCGATGSGPSAPDSASDVAPDHAEEELEQNESEVADAVAVPVPGQADVQPVPWDLVEWVEGDIIGFQFRSRGAPCEVLDRVEVDEDGVRVTATLFVGRDPSVARDDPRCEELPVLNLRAEVTLPSHQDGCHIYVDGADGSSVDTC